MSPAASPAPLRTPSSTQDIDVVVVGAGFSGLYLLHKLRSLGFMTQVLEAGDGVGGTWYWNRYPGARVDVESQEYSYSFDEALERDWRWSERYAAQPELLAYLNHVADRYDLRRDIRLATRVVSAIFDEGSGRWTIRTDQGEALSARFCIMATGCLSVPKDPDFVGMERFGGRTFHTGRWPHTPVAFKGERVAVIGTGSSAIQSIPQIARQADQVYVFQRTPNFSVPAHNGPIDPEVERLWREEREALRGKARQSGAGIVAIEPSEALALETPPEERVAAFESRWARGGFSLLGAFADLSVDLAANATVAKFVADKIRAIVKNPDVAERLIPKGYPIGSKRLCVDTGYYETFNHDHVVLVDVAASPIEAITETGVKTTSGAYEVDSIIYAIGFDAMTGALGAVDIRGVGGAALKEVWAHGPKTYLGLMVSGFPNLFMVTGPGSPSVLSNMVVSIEQHVDWIADCLTFMTERQMGRIEASPQAQEGWVNHVNAVGEATLYPLANSWYLGANIPGKPRVFMPYVGGVGPYREICDAVAAKGYEGFVIA